MSSRRDPEGWLQHVWAEGAPWPVTAALTALAGGYRATLAAREAVYRLGLLETTRLPVPVLSVGNLTVGGSGKTPLVELAVRRLVELGTTPVIVSRGYGRRGRGMRIVADRQGVRLDARAGGDEPVLLAERLRGVGVVVGENRAEAGRVAVEALGATVLVLDDAFQNRTVAKDEEVLVVNGRAPWGNGRLFPRGPLREPLGAVRRASLIVVTNPPGADAVAAVTTALRSQGASAPTVMASYLPESAWRAGTETRIAPAGLAGRRLVALAGLAAPEGFRATLLALGARVLALADFPDHHWFTETDLERVTRQARAVGAEALVTTEKDWMRLRVLPLPALPLWVLALKLVVDQDATPWQACLERVAGATSRVGGTP